ncbi:uncharacterized protein LOC132890022 [Neoarius graeffei]|uniref:uncharacterized protein LOC132890022 n=1 Tax=Neoarius graeffei TaxID=443677 RepID=UPI00298D5197|nr:uncharacterized protein LOC132890022 [Neoarius graeffei]
MLYTELTLKMITLMWITVMLFNQTDSAQINDLNQPNPVIAAGVGENVTLHCFKLLKENSGTIIWFKQKVGQEPQVMVAVQHEPKYIDEFKPPKFSIEKEKAGFHLKIVNVEPSDEALYYCGLLYFCGHSTSFEKGTFLSVKGDGDVKVSVIQSGVLDSVPAGASVTLQCSVRSESRAAEHQVLWFRAASPQSHPQIIYTHHNSSRQCESGSSTHTCVYDFSKNILSINDTGTYYCAVAVCGKIIFGNGTRVQLENSPNPEVIYFAVVVAVCVVVIFAQAFIICKMRSCKQIRVRSQQDCVAEETPNQGRDAVELNYAALHFKKNKTKRVTRKREKPDCIYSDVASGT